MKITKLIILFLALVFVSTACSLPFVGGGKKSSDTEANTSQSVIKAMQQKMLGLNTFNISHEVSFQLLMDMDKLSRLLDKGQIKLSLYRDPLTPVVMGIDNSSSMLFGGGDEQMLFNIKMNGAFDISDVNNPKQDIKLEIETESEGMALSAAGEVKMVDQVAYLRATKVPEMVKQFIPEEYLKKWWKIDYKKLEELKNDPEYKEEINTALRGQSWEDGIEMQKKMMTIMNEQDLLIIQSELPVETFANETCYHYQAGFNSDLLIRMIKEIINGSKEAFDMENIKSEDFNEMETMMKTIVDNFDIELWIGKDTKYLHKFNYNFSINSQDFPNKNFPLPEGNQQVNVDGTVLYSKFDQPVLVSHEAEAEDLVDVAAQSLKEARMKARDAKRMSDVKQMMTASELYNVDNDGYPETFVDVINSGYMSSLPDFPDSASDVCIRDEYEYFLKDKGKSYEIHYCMEN